MVVAGATFSSGMLVTVFEELASCSAISTLFRSEAIVCFNSQIVSSCLFEMAFCCCSCALKSSISSTEAGFLLLSLLRSIVRRWMNCSFSTIISSLSLISALCLFSLSRIEALIFRISALCCLSCSMILVFRILISSFD